MSQDHLEAFMLMTTDKEIFENLDTDQIFDIVAEKSQQMKQLLTT